MFKKYGVIGLIFIIFAFLFNIYEIFSPPLGLVIPHYFFVVGFWLFLDSFDFMVNKSSILYKIKNKRLLLFYLFLAGILIGIIFEFYGVFIANVWTSYFNSWPFINQVIHYPIGIIVGYVLPILMYISLFRISSTLIKKEFGKFGKKLIKKKYENNFFRLIGFIGIMFLILPLILYPFSLSWNAIIRGFLFGFCLIGLWFILEHIEYRQHKQSFLKELFEGKWGSLIAVVITATIISLIWENLGFIRPSWIYKNIPLMDITILGIPIFLILGWIFLILIYLSFFRIILKKNSNNS